LTWKPVLRGEHLKDWKKFKLIVKKVVYRIAVSTKNKKE